MADFNNQWIEIFRAGDYGPKGKWTTEKLRAAVANFKSGAWKPPAVLGHPKDDSPAMGWVDDLAVDGEVLKARFANVQPELEAHVRTKRFPNRSAAFYLDPKGNGPVLRHVGFLGAAPPEVKGLEPVKFSDGEFVAVEFQEETTMEKEEIRKTVGEEIRGFFAELFGKKKEADDGSFTEAEVQKRIETAQKPLLDRLDKLSSQFEENVKKANEASAAVSAESKKAGVRAFVDSRKAANQWVPAFTEAGIESVLEHLAIAGGTVKFGEAGKEKEGSPYELLKSFLENIPKIVPTGQIANRKVLDFADGITPKSVSDRAVAFQEEQRGKGVTMSTAEAVDHILGSK